MVEVIVVGIVVRNDIVINVLYFICLKIFDFICKIGLIFD